MGEAGIAMASGKLPSGGGYFGLQSYFEQ